MSRAAIICVDDEEIILRSLEKQLKRSIGQKYDIELASNADAALILCAELEAEGIAIALVISDQNMPGMSGDDFLIRLHASHPKTIKILLTGKAGAKEVGNIVNAAALYRYIDKPWDETDFILTVKEALRRYGQEKKIAQQNILLKRTNKSLKQSNQKLLKSLDLLLATLEATNDGILVLDNQNNVVIFNQQFILLWNLEPTFMTEDGNHLLGLIYRRITEPFTCDITRGKLQQCSLLKLVNGKTLECYSKIQQLEGKIVGTVWCFRDITAQEKAIT